MGKIKIFAYISIDGFMARSDGDIDWILELENPDNTDYGLNDFFDSVDTVVMNQNHYRMLYGYDLCDSCLSKHTILISTDSDYKITGNHDVEYVASDDRDFSRAVEYLEKYKTENQSDIWLAGDNELIHAAFESGLVDEITVTMLPVSLEAGAKLFPPGFKESKWRKTDEKFFQSGIVRITYRVIEPS